MTDIGQPDPGGAELASGRFEQMELSVRLNPQWLEARERLIDVCLKLHLFELAGEHIEIALAQNPQKAALRVGKAIVSIQSGRPDVAEEELEHALSLGPEMSERLRITLLFIKAGRLERALRTAEANSALAPGDPTVRLQRGFLALWQGDRSAAEKACENQSNPMPTMARLRAAIAFVAGRYADTLEIATDVLSQDSSDAGAHALKAGALLYLRRYREAEQSARDVAHATTEWVPAAQLIELAARGGPYPTVKRFEAEELFDLLAPLWRIRVTIPGTHPDVDSQPVLHFVDDALRRLSGNFTSAFTFIPEGSQTWSSFPLKPPSRTACLRIFDFIQARPWAWVAERMGALAAAYPRSPYVHTHAAELWLWFGDYAACEAECRQALALTKTEGSRWAWVGLGAALMFQERYAEAFEVLAESTRYTRPGSPLLAYRGETFRRCGDLDRAQQDLTESLELTPTRVSAWINRALIASARCDHDTVRDIYARLTRHLPELVRDVERDLPTNAPIQNGSVATMVATLEHALRVMRGNRSSNRITYFLRDGKARMLTTRILA